MSIRRQSCDTCFKSRRKCDLTHPICLRCQRSNKRCHYMYPAQLPGQSATDVVGYVTARPQSDMAPVDQSLSPRQPKRKRDGSPSRELRHTSVPRYLGHLGELPPITGESWVIDQIRALPLVFAARTETMFIHKDVYSGLFPRPLLAAFGICAACSSMNKYNQAMLFQAVDVEMSELLTSIPISTATEVLSRLQAILLYQTIRLFYGGIEQRIVAERQEYPVRTYALKLLQRAENEIQDTPQTWETWLLAESIRRAVMVAFKLHTIYQNFRHGACTEGTAIAMLPISAKPRLWDSQNDYSQDPDANKIVTYQQFSSIRSKTALATMEPFERLLVMGCPLRYECEIFPIHESGDEDVT